MVLLAEDRRCAERAGTRGECDEQGWREAGEVSCLIGCECAFHKILLGSLGRCVRPCCGWGPRRRLSGWDRVVDRACDAPRLDRTAWQSATKGTMRKGRRRWRPVAWSCRLPCFSLIGLSARFPKQQVEGSCEVYLLA